MLATYADDFFAGSPAVTENSHGKGRAIYVSAHLSSEDWHHLISRVAAESGIFPPAKTSPGVEAVRRGDHLFLINHNPVAGSADIATTADLEKPVDHAIEPFGVRVLECGNI